MSSSRLASFLISILAAVLLMSCASVPPSTTLPQARVAVEAADGRDIRLYAGPELKAAQDKLAAAEQAELQKNSQQAEYLAQQSMAILDLANAKTKAQQTRNSVKELERTIRNLEAEAEWRAPISVTPLEK